MNPENQSTAGEPENTAAAKSDKAKIDNRERLGEITAVLRKHHITRGVTPEKLRAILEDLGPTYVKLGQIMSLHSDVLPQRYCDELMKLTSEVTPMPFGEVEEVINRSYREDWHNIFASINRETLGSASIAQVHKATLLDGKEVIVRVTDRGPYVKGRIIDLSVRAARELGIIAQGIAPVTVERYNSANIPFEPENIIDLPEFDIGTNEGSDTKPIWMELRDQYKKKQKEGE